MVADVVILCRDGKIKVAQKYFMKTLDIEVHIRLPESSIAGTHLNICTILSLQKK